MLSEISEFVLQYLGIDTTKNAKNTLNILNIIEHYKTFRRLEVLDLPRLWNSTSSRDSTLAFMEEGSHVHMSLDGLKMWWTDVNGQRCVHKWPSEACGRMKATDFRPRPRWNVNHMKQLRIPKLHRNSLSRKVFGDTQWRTYQEFGELCKACRAETGSNFPCGVCNAWAIFFKHVDFRTLELVCERLAWSPFPKLRCWWTEDVRRYNAGLFCILEFNFVWFSGNLRLSRILDDSSKRLC